MEQLKEATVVEHNFTSGTQIKIGTVETLVANSVANLVFADLCSLSLSHERVFSLAQTKVFIIVCLWLTTQKESHNV